MKSTTENDSDPAYEIEYCTLGARRTVSQYFVFPTVIDLAHVKQQ